MLRTAIDRNFVRYARTGDPGALARVFDGSAAELYRIGFHLLGDRHAAEDLVQQTFVVAIEQAKSFDGSRRVLPWLCGILTHRALHVRRQSRAHAATAAPVEVMVDPAAEASAKEVAERVAATVRSLPEPYRQVLLLHLVHELTPKEVAEALARPDATVRTQLARGLELLRRALPLGIAGLAAGCVPLPIGLANVRAAVLVRAAAEAAALSVPMVGAVVTFSGVVLMKKAMLVVAALLAVWCSWAWWGSDPVVPIDVVAGEQRPVIAQGAPGPAEPSPSRDVVEQIAAPASPATDAAALELLVQWHDGTPAVGVTVRCRPRPLDVEAWLRVVRTGDDGVARFERLPPGPANALTDRGAAVDLELAAGTTQQGSIRLAPGIDVQGRVVDIDERPFAGATVWMSVVPHSDDGEAVAVSGHDGTFTIRGAAIDHVVAATAPGFATAKVERVKGRDLLLTMRPAPGALVGTVVDTRGQPVAGARLLVGLAMPRAGVHRRFLGEVFGQDKWPARFLRTDAHGRFRCDGLPPWKWPLWVGASGFAPSSREVQVLAAGETDVTVQLTHGATLRGRVVDAAGAAVAGADIWAFPHVPELDNRITLGADKAVQPPLWWRSSTTTGAQGEYSLHSLPPGSYTTTAWRAPRDSARSRCELRDGETLVWDATLEPEGGAAARPLHGMLVDENGAPLPSWVIRVGEPGNPHNPSRIGVGDEGAFRTNRVPPGRYRLHVQPSHRMIGDEVDLGEFDVADCPLRLVVPRVHVPTSRVRGRVVRPDGAPPSECRVSVWPVGTGSSVHVSCDVDGNYEAGPLQRGSYRLKAGSAAFGEVMIGSIDVVDGRDTDAGMFQAPAPGTLVVTFVDPVGNRLPDAWVSAGLVEEGSLVGAMLEHRDGVARGNVQAGRWRVATHDLTTMAAMEVDVRPGETTDARLVIHDGVPFVLRVPHAVREHGRLRLRWHDGRGSLLREGRVYDDYAGTDKPLSAPEGAYVLEVTGAAGGRATAAFDLRASEPPQVVELPLPPR